jgi:hypothetical protein
MNISDILFDICHENGHYAGYVNGKLYCTGDTYHEVEISISEYSGMVREIRQLKQKLEDELEELLEYQRNLISDLQWKNQILKDSIKQLEDECSKKDGDIHY